MILMRILTRAFLYVYLCVSYQCKVSDIRPNKITETDQWNRIIQELIPLHENTGQKHSLNLDLILKLLAKSKKIITSNLAQKTSD